jgi:3-dehydroquinate synthase
MASVLGETPSPLRSQLPPGALGDTVDSWGPATTFFESEPLPLWVVADAKVLRLHPKLKRALSRHTVMSLTASEAVKSMTVVERLAAWARLMPRSGTVVALGGGTIGDLTAVFAHLHKRGVRLIQVPTTLLAAVDSSVGGKGAVNVKGVKNALGVFHQADSCWLCPELWQTLKVSQHQEAYAEAVKMAVTLDANLFSSWARAWPDEQSLVKESRRLKQHVCELDPYERKGIRVVLNFGHSFGHALETLSGYQVPHGEAVALGMVCALDLGVRLGVTTADARQQVLGLLPQSETLRQRLGKVTRPHLSKAIAATLHADKKNERQGQLKMVLLQDLGKWTTQDVDQSEWISLLGAWKKGVAP